VVVVDACVLTNAFTDDGPVGTHSRAELARDAHWASVGGDTLALHRAVTHAPAGQVIVADLQGAVHGHWGRP